MSDTFVYSLIALGALIVLLGLLRLRRVSMQNLILGTMGTILGLILGALASEPLSKLPSPFDWIAPIAATVLFVIIGLVMVISRRASFVAIMPFLRSKSHEASSNTAGKMPRILVDTSAIIDGRIADIATAGFVPGRLVVPRFVLAELQNIADSEDAMRRGRGRRGLDVLNQLRDMPDVEVDIIDDDIAGIREVDAKLVALGQKFHCNVLTTDYNLNRVAQIQGVRVLNVNELSNAIRPVVLPGEELRVRVVQPGKERNQGVGYLADGTMIVVENGDKLIGQDVTTEVTRVFQTVAGKMIFAAPKNMPKPQNQPQPEPLHAPKMAAPSPESAGDQPRPNQQKPRFNRGRKPSESRELKPHDIEGRIIAATSNPDQPSRQA